MRWKLLAVFGLSLFLSVSTFAQFKASIQGTVLDPSGNAVTSAKVVVTNQATGISHDTTTSPQGFYRINELPPGAYTVSVEAAGFKKSVNADVAVEAEQPRGFDVKLEIGAVTQSVTVTASGEGHQSEDA